MWQWAWWGWVEVEFGDLRALFQPYKKKNNLKAYERKDALLSKGLPYIFPCAER